MRKAETANKTQAANINGEIERCNGKWSETDKRELQTTLRTLSKFAQVRGIERKRMRKSDCREGTTVNVDGTESETLLRRRE